MPAQGDQHRDTPATVNPFLDHKRQITEYTAQEIATLQSRLEKQLGPEYISTRPGNGGGKVHYLAAEKVINLANEVFGFNGWSSQIQQVQIDFVDENPSTGRINLGLSTIVRVTLRDGTFHEDVGYGHCENTKGKAAAFEKAKKEAATDAMKRALRNFGNVLGNCLYDKDYLQKVAKVKVAPSKWDAQNLHRHPDFAPVKKEPAMDEAPRHNQSAIQRKQSAQSGGSFGSAEFEDEFGENIFDETDFSHPDEVRIDETVAVDGMAAPVSRPTSALAPQSGHPQGVTRTDTTPLMRNQNLPAQQSGQAAQGTPKSQNIYRPSLNAGQAPHARMPPPHIPGNPSRPQLMATGLHQQSADGSRSNSSSGSAHDTTGSTAQHRQENHTNGQPQQPKSDQIDDQGFPVPRQPPQGIPDGFVTGRRADMFNHPPEARPPIASVAFNPHADSPSIRRTQGVNPGKSAPVSRMQLAGQANAPQSPAAQSALGNGFQGVGTNGLNGAQRPTGTNFVNPAADVNRRIGMPQTGGPGGFQGRPGGYKAPTAVKRPAMADVTNIQPPEGVPDAKKTKVEGDNGQAGDQSTVAM